LNSKIALFFVVLALVGAAFYVVRAKERRRHAAEGDAPVTQPEDPRASPSAAPSGRVNRRRSSHD